MKIKRELQPRASLEQFADAHDLTMKVCERPQNCWKAGRFYAYFEKCEEKGDGVLIGTMGNGETEDQAIADYGHRISGKTLVIDGTTLTRREMRVPIIERAAE